MIVEYIRYKLPDGLNIEFEKDYAKAVEFLSASSVCHGYELTHCEEEPQRYVLRILWTSTEDHLTIFRSSEEFKGFFALIKSYIPYIEEMQHYNFTGISLSK